MELALEPQLADAGAVVQLHGRRDAHVFELPLQHLRHVLAHGKAGLRDEREGKALAVLVAHAVAVAVAPAGLVEEGLRARRIERVLPHLRVVRPRHRLHGPVRDRRQPLENRRRDERAVNRVGERLAHAHVGKRRKGALVERDVLVAVAVDAVHRHAGDGRHLAMLVPGEHHHHVHFPALQLVDAGVGVGDELEEQRLDGRELRAAPVVRRRLETDVLAALPLRHLVGAGAERRAVVVVGGVDVAALEHVLRQGATHELQRVGRVDLLVVQHGRERVGRVDAADPVEAVGALGVVGRAVDRLDRELHVGGGVRRAVVPCHLGPQPPGDVHPAVFAQHHAAVLERGHRRGQERHDGHLFVGGDQPFDHAGLDVLEDVRAEAVERVGLAVVADDQAAGASAGRRRGAGRRCGAGGRCGAGAGAGARAAATRGQREYGHARTRKARGRHDAAWSASISFAINATGMAPWASTRLWNASIENALPWRDHASTRN